MALSDIGALLGSLIRGGARPDISVTGLSYRSDTVEPGHAFFAIPGFRHDGRDFAADAVSRGAVVVVAEKPVEGLEDKVVIVDSARHALAVAADRHWGRPSCDMTVIGVTGTNGKTTTTYLTDSILRAAGKTTGVVGTVETRIGDTRIDAERTTPESADLQRLFAQMRHEGVDAVSMEVSSHAIDLNRVDGVRFAVAAFTNLTQDHLDYHHSVEEYFSVKKRLFTDLDVRARVVNIDDPMGAGLAAELAEVITVGTTEEAHVRAEEVELDAEGASFELVTPAGRGFVRLPLAGQYNISNALVAAGCGVALGTPVDVIRTGLESAQQVPGRLERIEMGQPFAVYVDYAHTPDSLEKAIAAVRHVTSGRVIVVFGAGGDRDPDKRPVMGAAAGRSADHAVVTSDNPRSEDPVGIILQIEDGLKGQQSSYEVVIDRREAIAHAISQATTGDAVLIAGKGHEDYQIFADRTIHFDDREVAREELSKRC